jgi:hypothetical protein
MFISMTRERKKLGKVRNLLRHFSVRLISGLTKMGKKDLSDSEYIDVLEKKNTKLSRLVDISEAQKQRLKRQNEELKQKIAEILRNSS